MGEIKNKSLAFVLGLLWLALGLRAQEKFALVIGNGAYTSVSQLKNPVNDAADMADTLKDLGFKVELLRNSTLDDMENAVIRLGNNLEQSPGSYGFFFYAGHGVQSNGINYLIPIDADIKSEAFLKNRALAAQEVLDTLQQAGNGLNVVVLDACRDNPFSWARSGTRGLAVVSSQPPGSIIVFATSAGSTAQDGTGRNGLFTSQFLKNLKTPGLEIKDVFNKTGADVMAASNNKQVPAIFTQFYKTAYLAGSGKLTSTTAFAPIPNDNEPEFGSVTVATGALTISLATAGILEIAGKTIEIPAGGTLPVNKLAVGEYLLSVTYADGKKETKSIEVTQGATVAVAFSYRQASPTKPIPMREGGYAIGDTGPAGGIKFYDKGKERDGWRYLEAAPNDTVKYYPGEIAKAKYAGGDYHDWRLPTSDELKLMYGNLHKNKLGHFAPICYWSSSRSVENGQPEFLDFSSGAVNYPPHDSLGYSPNFSIRFIRQF